MGDTKIEKELHIMNGLLRDIRDELRKGDISKNIAIEQESSDIQRLENENKYLKRRLRDVQQYTEGELYDLL